MSTELGTTEFGIPMQTGIPEAQLATDGSDSPAPEEAHAPAGGADDPQRRHRTVVTQLEQRIRDITPMVSVEESPARGRRASQELVPDPSVLVDLEAHARSIASNVDMVLRDLRGSLRGMSDLTLESMQVYSTSINSTCDSVDAAIRSTYTMLAKAEELNASMEGVQKLAQQVKDCKRLLDMFESTFQQEPSSTST